MTVVVAVVVAGCVVVVVVVVDGKVPVRVVVVPDEKTGESQRDFGRLKNR